MQFRDRSSRKRYVIRLRLDSLAACKPLRQRYALRSRGGTGTEQLVHLQQVDWAQRYPALLRSAQRFLNSDPLLPRCAIQRRVYDYGDPVDTGTTERVKR